MMRLTDQSAGNGRNGAKGTPPPEPPSPPLPVLLRLAQNHPPSSDSEMAQLFRHSIKQELNALGLGARCLLLDDELGNSQLPVEGRAFLQTIDPLVKLLAAIVDQVRRLPVQPLEPQALA